MRRLVGLFGAVAALLAASAQAPGPREIAFIANAEGGTISLVDVGRRAIVGTINVNPGKVRQNQATPNYAQDSDVSPDGRTLYVSRGYLGDVAAFDIASGRLKWRTTIDPSRADHMVLSRDGRTLFVSAYTRSLTLRLDTAGGAITGQVATGPSPHDNQLSQDGKLLFNSSIGNVGLPIKESAETGEAPYRLTIADAQTLKIKDKHIFETGLRPWRFAPGEQRLYAQMSDQHAVIAYDLAARKITRRLQLPIGKGVTPADWVYAAPHHGLALSADGRTLCLAGRASDYAALVRAPELTLIATIPVGDAPGWSELADNDRVCILANTRSDDISFISVADRKELIRFKTGDGPKHITVARVPADVLAKLRP